MNKHPKLAPIKNFIEPYSRRSFLKALSIASSTPLLLQACSGQSSHSPSDPWINAEKIVRSIVTPKIPNRDFIITSYGAKNNFNEDSSQAINAAIADCAQQGGGRVIIPKGQFLTGPIHLKSNINLHIAEGSTLKFIRDPKRYLPAVFTRWEGVELMGYSPFIYAYKQNNIAITGKGTLDGNANADHWWPWKGPRGDANWNLIEGEDQKIARTNLFKDAENGVPPQQRLYADGSFIRPSFVETYQCNNILFEDITITNSPFWLVHPVLCNNITIRGIKAESHGPNNDGCNPESCRNVLIENCHFNTGDDCIALKSGRNTDGRRVNVPVENVVIRNCQMQDGHGGVVLGSEISGGANNIFVENCQMSSPDLDRAIRIKTNSHRGGLIENIHIRNINVGTVRDAIVINFFYEEGDSGTFDPIVRNISIDNLQCEKAQRAFYIRGFDRAPIKNFRISNSQFESVSKTNVIENVEGMVARNTNINGKLFEVG